MGVTNLAYIKIDDASGLSCKGIPVVRSGRLLIGSTYTALSDLV